jgi:hypothetical membrane protein
LCFVAIRSEARRAGTLLIVGGIGIFAGILIAQGLFPGYDPSKTAISDLGAPIELAYHQSPGFLTIQQPSSIIFITSVFVFSIAILSAVRLLLRIGRIGKWFSRFLTLFGVGGLLVVISYLPYYAYSGQLIQGSFGGDPFPLIIGALVHLVGALLIFIFGGLSAIVAYSFLQRRLMGSLSAMLGLIVIGAFVLNLGGFNLGLGNGGMERLAAYPLFLWVVGIGAFLRLT